MSLPTVVSREDWLVARKLLLAKEKELTRRRDALNVERRNLTMVEIVKDYAFEGPNGRAGLVDLFEGRRQLIVGHFTTSCFLRDGDAVFHTYSTFGRGAEMLGGSYYWLDLTALGRQEDWEEPKGRASRAHAASPDFSG